MDNRELLRTQEQSRVLQKLDQAVDEKKIKIAEPEDLYRFQKEEISYATYAQSLGVHVDVAMSGLQAEQQKISPFCGDVARYEKQKKKEKDQEKDADAKAKRMGLEYATNQEAVLAQMSTQQQQYAKEHPLPQSYHIDGCALKGDEFAPDPNTGQINIEGLLEKHRRLEHQMKMYEQAKRSGEKIEPETASVLDCNKKLFQVLDDAIQTYWSANGVNAKTGEKIGRFKRKSAQRHLALAMENYREQAAMIQDSLGSMVIERLKKDRAEEYQHNKEQMANKDVALDTTGDYTTGMDNIRQWITGNPDKYEQNQDMVNKLYKEYLVCAKAGGEVYREKMALDLMLPSERRGVMKCGGDWLDKESEKKGFAYKAQAQHIQSALCYILKGEEPKEVSDMLYLEQHCGMITKGRAEYKKKEAMIGIQEPRKILRVTDPESAELQLKYNAVRMKFALAQYEAKRNLEENPEDEVAQKIVTRLGRTENSGEIGSLLDALEVATVENQKRNIQTGRFTDGKYTCANGRRVQISNGGAYRDMALNIMPIGQAHKMTDKELEKAYDNYQMFDNETKKKPEKIKHLDGTDATEEDLKEAFAGEIEVDKKARKDVEDYISNHKDVFENASMTGAQLLDAYMVAIPVHAKCQSLAARVNDVMKNERFQKLPQKERDEIKEMGTFFTAAYSFVRQMRARIREKESYLQGGSLEDVNSYPKTLSELIESNKNG